MNNPVVLTVILLLIVISFLFLAYGSIRIMMAENMADSYSKYQEYVSGAKSKIKLALSLLLGTLAVAYMIGITTPSVIWSY